MLTRILGYMLKYWTLAILAVAITIVQAFLGANLPLIMIRDVVDIVLAGGQPALLAYYLTIGLIIYAALSALSFSGRYVQAYVSQRAIADIRESLVRSLQKKSFSFYDQTQTGQLVARLTGDVDSVNRLYFFFLTALFSPIATAVFSIYFLSGVDIRLTGLCALSIPIVLGINFAYRRKVQPQWRKIREMWGSLNQYLQEFLVGVKVVRIFTREDYEGSRFTHINKEYYDSNVDVINTQAVYSPLSSFGLGLVIAIIFWYGGGEAVRGTLSVGSLLVFSRYVSMFLQPFMMVGFFISSYSRAMAGATRIFSIMDIQPDIQDRQGAVELDSVRGDIEFQHVYFAYEKGRSALEDVNLYVKAGESVAILGPTGSGKSTFIYLIPRFYDVTSGSITLDGRDVRDYKLEFLRRQVGVVLQDVFLFSLTMRENIAFGRPDATLEEVIEAAKAAQAHDFISAMPKGYDTVIGERGVTLSGGQRQRIAIARTLLMNPKILIFDDSTSFVDADTEAAIQSALDRLLEGRTTFIVTHRLSTIKRANRIVILDKGRIAEVGTHEELLRKKGIYTRIYETQFAEADKLPRPKQIHGGD
ncbi:MAG: ABC transporter ATP-binding protein [Candidatus Bathyarchaeota archaeon]